MTTEVAISWQPDLVPIVGETYLRVTADTPPLVWANLRRGVLVVLETPTGTLAWDLWRVVEMRAATQEIVVRSLVNPSSFQATVTLEQLNLLSPLVVVTYPKLPPTAVPRTGEVWSMHQTSTLAKRRGAMWAVEQVQQRTSRSSDSLVLLPLVFKGVRWRQLEVPTQAPG